MTGEPDKPVDPVVSKGMVTSEHRLDETQSTQLRHEQQVMEKPTESPNVYEQTSRIKDSESASPKVSSVKTISVPTKKEDEKENVNIVFIGHVGKFLESGHKCYHDYGYFQVICHGTLCSDMAYCNCDMICHAYMCTCTAVHVVISQCTIYNIIDNQKNFQY